ncbi:MAG: anaerobic ribonucleoside-triphosphate reductase activating protein [Alphaproteobacteria bacterium]|nr:anaerobic ribonucleoside-triphosphate reductase activating protein [Alphaproteobacteria bacterium]
MGQIYEITTFSMLDYPNELSCIVWISGCNLRCKYCHNPDIVKNRGEKDDAEVLAFLRARQGRLTAVVFSGGEATFCPTLPNLVRKAKELGYKTKLDTNGSNPGVVRRLLDEGLLDMVALDYKAPPNLVEKVCGTARFENDFRETLQLLIDRGNEGRVAFEVRTTVSPDILSEEDVSWMIEDLDMRGYRGTYYLQHLASFGERTLGNIPEPKGCLDRGKLPSPKGFKLGFRNFPGTSPEPRANTPAAAEEPESYK